MTVEVRRNDDGSVDEVVVHEASLVHIEQMANNAWWMRIDVPGEDSVVINFTSKRAAISALVEREAR